MVGKKQNIGPMWQNSKERILTSKIQHHCAIKCILRCTQREAKIDPQAVQAKIELFRKLTMSGEAVQAKENYSLEKVTAWSFDMEGHAGKCKGRYCASAQKDVSILQLVATPCIDDHQIPPGDCEKTGELSAVYLARIGRPFFLWSNFCKISDKMEQSLRQKITAVDQLYQSNPKLHTILPRGKQY